ncbi:unnamed protein product [Durusdinium trenchii]|uniref:Uncharacterized protein n=2 Tax=Durusdinium trenchii TaxID=1381693 RepID=A0ABP0SK96_9DINO
MVSLWRDDVQTRLCRFLTAAPAEWRNEQSARVRKILFYLAALLTGFSLSRSFTRPLEEAWKVTFIASKIVGMVTFLVAAVIQSYLKHWPNLLEVMTFVLTILSVVAFCVANAEQDFEWRFTTATRTYIQFCYGAAVIFGFRPSYQLIFLIACTVIHVIFVTNLAFYDQDLESLGGLPEGLVTELTIECLLGFFSIAAGILMNSTSLSLYYYQEQSKQESEGFSKLLSLSCDFVLPLRWRPSTGICISQADPQLKAYVGSVQAGDRVESILSEESYQTLTKRLENLAPMQPLLMPVTLQSGHIPLSAEMLLVRCQHVDDSSKYLVGVRVNQEIAPPDALGEAPRPDFHGILPSAPDQVRNSRGIFEADSEFGKSDAAFTTKTGQIFNCSKPKEAWRNILQLGRKEHWLVPAENLSVQPRRILGSGGFGLACEGKYCGAKVAVKVPRKSFSVEEGQEATAAISMLMDYLQELRLLRIARHPNIVIFYGAFMAPPRGEVALVFERMEGPTLDLFILSGEVADHYKARMMLDITNALLYLHSLRPQIVHGDVKPGNVFVECREGQMQTKLADFGLARRITFSASTMGGTLRWAAPELLHGARGPSTSADIYSLGQLMYFILSARRPYTGLTQSQCHTAITQGGMCFLLKPVIDHCRRHEPLERPKAGDVAEVLENFVQPGDRAQSTQIDVFTPNLRPQTLPGFNMDSDMEEEEELDDDTKLCQAFDCARMVVMQQLRT